MAKSISHIYTIEHVFGTYTPIQIGGIKQVSWIQTGPHCKMMELCNSVLEI